MTVPAGPLPERAQGWKRPGVALLVLASVGMALWGGCTVTPKNYKVLSFFFDGVPDPALTAVGEVRGRDGVVRASKVWVHQPFAEDKCDACHTTRYRPTKNNGSICLPCHEKVPTEYVQMHGPVTAQACIWCHNPHESRYPHLLRDPDRKVCAQCHSGNLLDSSRVPAHADESRACLECHVGHGANGRFLLRDGAEAGRPLEPAAPAAVTEK